jgi:peptidoglycan hydrolase-like protein with peptidoglycan-binding domain
MTQHSNRLPMLGLLVSTLTLGLSLPAQAQSYPSSLLQPSDQGGSVAELQENLARLGYYRAAVTGDFDAATQEAVMQFQQANGLAADGIVGAETQAALNGGAGAAPGSEAPAESAQTSALQQQLVQLGYYKGTVNGVFDSATQEAVMSFQRDRGLEVDGIVGSATESALYQAPADETSTAAAATYTASTAATPSATPTDGLLQLGDTGSEVSDLQSRLQTLGYYDGPISGSFGSQTQVALTAFQQAQGLTADGIAGPQVEAALASAAIPTAQPAPATPIPAVAPAALPQTLPQMSPAPQTAVSPATLPAASVQVPGLTPAIPEAVTPPTRGSSPSTAPREGGRFSVSDLQRRLQLNGFDPAEITGEYDAATQNAINQAQQSYGLSGEDFSN